MRETSSLAGNAAAAGGAATFGGGVIGGAVVRSSDHHSGSPPYTEDYPPPYHGRQSLDMQEQAIEPQDITRQSHAPRQEEAIVVRDPFADNASDNLSLLSGETDVNQGPSDCQPAAETASIVSSLSDVDEVASIREAHALTFSRQASFTTGPAR